VTVSASFPSLSRVTDSAPGYRASNVGCRWCTHLEPTCGYPPCSRIEPFDGARIVTAAVGVPDGVGADPDGDTDGVDGPPAADRWACGEDVQAAATSRTAVRTNARRPRLREKVATSPR